MSVELLQTLSMGGYIASGVFLILAVILFFTLRIPEVIGDLSGATARKAIEDIRRQNEQSGDKAYKPSRVNRERGALTDKISPSGRLEKKTGILGGSVATSKLNTKQLADEANESSETTLLQPGAAETTLLQPESAETTLLQGETTVLQPETTILSANISPETTVLTAELSQQMEAAKMGLPQESAEPIAVSVDVELGFCESTEIIE